MFKVNAQYKVQSLSILQTDYLRYMQFRFIFIFINDDHDIHSELCNIVTALWLKPKEANITLLIFLYIPMNFSEIATKCS